MIVDINNWNKFGQTSNADFYEVSPGILAVVPFNKCTDNETTAKASVQTQLDYLRSKKQRAAIVIFMDNIIQQTAGARTVYRCMPEPTYQVCFALVGGTVFGRAVGSVFLGLSKPSVPTQMFGSFEQALEWCRLQVDKVG